MSVAEAESAAPRPERGWFRFTPGQLALSLLVLECLLRLSERCHWFGFNHQPIIAAARGGVVLALLLWLITGWRFHVRFHHDIRSRLVSMNDGQATRPDDYKDYCFDSSWEGDGQILDRENTPLWRYRSDGGNILRSSVYGFFHLPAFIIQDLEEHELLAFERTRRFPSPVFEIREGHRLVGTVRQQSFLWTKYLLEFESGLRCTFYLPPFTIWFKGTTESGGVVLVRMWQHRIWFVRVNSSIDSFHLVAAIAFIHRERLRHG